MFIKDYYSFDCILTLPKTISLQWSENSLESKRWRYILTNISDFWSTFLSPPVKKKDLVHSELPQCSPRIKFFKDVGVNSASPNKYRNLQSR